MRTQRETDLEEEIERLQARVDELDKGYAQLQKFVDAQADDAALWGYAQYISEAYIQRGLRGCHAFIEQTIKALEGDLLDAKKE